MKSLYDGQARERDICDLAQAGRGRGTEADTVRTIVFTLPS